MENITTYLEHAFNLFGVALNSAVIYYIAIAWIKIIRQKDWRKILLVTIAGGLAIYCISGVMGGERSVNGTIAAVNAVLSLGITWTLVIIAAMALMMHVLMSLFYNRKPFQKTVQKNNA